MRDEPLTHTTSPGRDDGTLILTLTGPLTLTNLFAFQHEFRALKPKVLILDLTRTEYMDSAGLGLLVNYYVSAQNEHRTFLLAGVNHRLMALLTTTRVDSVLRTFPTVEAAEASL